MISELVEVELYCARIIASRSGNDAQHPGPLEASNVLGQDTLGGVLSVTRTLMLACDEAPAGSLTLRVTVCSPSEKETETIAWVLKTAPPSLHSYVSGSPSGSVEWLPSSFTRLGHSTC